jgi:imidazolonepropionase-like amidohydrolase
MRKQLFGMLATAIMSHSALGDVIYAGTLIDGSGAKPRQNVTLFIEGNTIRAIENGFSDAGDDTLIDLRDYTVLPGLMDMHVHLDGEYDRGSYLGRFTRNEADYALNAAHFANKTLQAGFTTVRNPGDNFNATIALRNAIDSGKAIGPRIFSAGKSLATTGGHADPTNGFRHDLMGNPGPEAGVVNGPADAWQAVRQRYKDGADFIKLTVTGGVLSVAKSGDNPQFNDDELEAVMAAAKDYNFHVAVHAHGAEGMKRALRAGAKTVEHGTYMDKEAMGLFKRNNAFYVPTITAGKWVAEKAAEEGYYPALVRPKAAAIGPLIQDTFSRAYKAGVPIVFGTDAGVFPHGLNAREFGYMVEAGMPPMEAIVSATKTAAELLKIDDKLGTLSAGKLADIVAVKGDPLVDIKVLENIQFVMKDGRVYKHQE